jgi:ketosteroid isomerase-like protein
MRKFLLLLVSSFLFSTAAPAAQFTGDESAAKQVLQIFQQWTAAYEKGDLPGSMSIFDPGVIFAFQGGRDQNYEDLRKGYVDDFATRKPGTVWVPRIDEVHAEGTVAFVRSVWELKVKSASGEMVVMERNRSVDILSKSSGAWHIIRSFNYPEKAPAA